MNFETAKKKLADIAKGEYHQIRYSVCSKENRVVRQECSLYINDIGFHEAQSWERAFKKLDEKLNPPEEPPTEEQQPGEEVE